ncbi:tripartite tricarboxylate transporter substrate binding protein [uncultured Xylophilus sp.]|uniref:Bug family tripartite tricarboxylate transporter substrate binding protein n=1 Tax=uncultured Xylophilus sp. TaxID=296832 RepID=UPI0025CBF4FC|nr:tripartite tricarboxylate transporter substrate binding protein [uncultured Xylophilus sp.]
MPSFVSALRGTRRTALALAAGTLAALAALPAAAAYPDRPVRIVVPYSAGGGTDTFARLVGQELGRQLGQSVVIDNRPGASGLLGGAAVAQAPADGYTLLVDQSSIATNPLLYAKPPYDVNRDLAPVGLGATLDNVLLVNPQLPARNVTELIALAKSRPGKLNYASTGVGTPQHLAMEVIKDSSGTDIVHVPYKGGNPGIVALAADEVQMFFISVSTAMPFVKSGKVRALASGGTQRSPLLPEVPTVSESGLPGFQATGWLAFFAPAGTPAPVIRQLNAALAKALAVPALVDGLRQQGFEPAPGTPEALGALVKRDQAQYGPVIRKANIKVE